MPTEKPLAVAETFASIQGETSFAGWPAFFIRLAGCNLRCRWCDARYTHEEPAARLTAVAQLLDEVYAQPWRLVVITGGEPLLQPAVLPLLAALGEAGCTVLLETNGSLAIAAVPAPVVRIVDVKCPGSGMAGSFLLANLRALRPQDEVKLVLADHADYQWARDFIRRHHLWTRATVLLSPVADTLPPGLLGDWILADGLPVRLQVQLHRLLWPERLRGA
ncbi:MAG: radical SAM protein [Thermodesulfobacteriota bacterium]